MSSSPRRQTTALCKKKLEKNAAQFRITPRTKIPTPLGEMIKFPFWSQKVHFLLRIKKINQKNKPNQNKRNPMKNEMKSCYTKFSGAYNQDPLFWYHLYLLMKFQNEIARKKFFASSSLLLANIWNQDALTEPGTE